jgi:hypothetical protein
MQNSLLDVGKLEEVLQRHWAEFLDPVQVMRLVLEHVRNTSFRTIYQAEIPKQCTKISVTGFIKIGDGFQVWIEFTVPKNTGVIMGTVLLRLELSGKADIEESFGTVFMPETLDNL